MKKRRYSTGRKKWSLTQMHSSKGTAFFQKLSPGAQRNWASWDSKRSRKINFRGKMSGMMRKGGMIRF